MARPELWLPPRAQESYKKAPPPKLGEAFGVWSGRDMQYVTLPGGGVIQFDLSRLTLADYRAMREHYQINASLSVLQFMMHRVDWTIQCENKKIKEFVEVNLGDMWTRLIRAMSQAYWCGYAPTVIQWENNVTDRKVEITKFKDLVPEECRVNWKQVEGWAPAGVTKPKYKVFDGIRQQGVQYPIPVENSVWYPLLMENGDYYGKKLLKPAFPSWFFSILIHLFVNRYFERFGEPLPIGRADYQQEVEIDGQSVNGRVAMERILESIRSRAVTVLPSDRTPVGDSGRSEYDFDIQYLESQMRGADFERYLSRLDEEMSIGLFTPMLLLRTNEVGSYNLGVGQMQMYMWMLNALAGDLKEYIDKYIIAKMVAFNFGPNAAKCRWEYRKMGKENVETMRAVVTEVLRKGTAKPDLDELGDIVGLSLTEVKVLTEPPAEPEDVGEEDPEEDPDKPRQDDRVGGPRQRPSRKNPKGGEAPRKTGKQISARIRSQATSAFRQGMFGPAFQPDMGHRSAMEKAFRSEDADTATAFSLTNDLYRSLTTWLESVTSDVGIFEDADQFMTAFDLVLETEIDRLVGSASD